MHLLPRTSVLLMMVVSVGLTISINGPADAQVGAVRVDSSASTRITTATGASPSGEPSATTRALGNVADTRQQVNPPPAKEEIRPWIAPTIVGVVIAAGVAAILLGSAQGKRQQRRRESLASVHGSRPEESDNEQVRPVTAMDEDAGPGAVECGDDSCAGDSNATPPTHNSVEPEAPS